MTSPKLSSRRLALLSGFALLGVIGAASVCSAEGPWPRRVAPGAAPPPYRVALVEPGGGNLPTFRHAGRDYVLGEPGARYDVRVDNPTAERVEAVVTIDGRDAVSGQPGEYVTQRGYLIEPWGSVLIEGFRRDLDEVAAFRFTTRGQSYSALRGTPENVGVIGVAIFPERARTSAPLRPSARQYPYRDVPAPAAPRAEKSRAAGASDGERDEAAPRKRSGAGGPSNIGTQYGEREESSVIEVAFERRSKTHPTAVLTLRYDDYDGLAARGIDLSSLSYAYGDPREPDPFPYSRFAPPPR